MGHGVSMGEPSGWAARSLRLLRAGLGAGTTLPGMRLKPSWDGDYGGDPGAPRGDVSCPRSGALPDCQSLMVITVVTCVNRSLRALESYHQLG